MAAGLDFKSSTLRGHGAESTAQRIEVPIDLRRDWPIALRRAGFDPESPTAWSAEGLLRYLPSQVQDLLFERIHAMSAPGSQIVVNAPTHDAQDLERLGSEQELRRFGTVLGAQGRIPPPDVEELTYLDEKRTDVTKWLAEHGWETSAVTVSEAVARYGRGPGGEQREKGALPSVFISGRRMR